MSRMSEFGQFFFFQAEDGIRDYKVTGVQTCALPIWEVFARTHGDFAASVAELTGQLTVHAKAAESIGLRVAASKSWTFMGVDPTPAPLADVSIGAAIETYTGSRFGSSGTLTAALIITTA